MTLQEFKNGTKFKVPNCVRSWEYFYNDQFIMSIDDSKIRDAHAFVLAMDSKYVYVRSFIMGQAVKTKIPLNTLEII